MSSASIFVGVMTMMSDFMIFFEYNVFVIRNNIYIYIYIHIYILYYNIILYIIYYIILYIILYILNIILYIYYKYIYIYIYCIYNFDKIYFLHLLMISFLLFHSFSFLLYAFLNHQKIFIMKPFSHYLMIMLVFCSIEIE